MTDLRGWIEWAAQGVEALAVTIMLVFILGGTMRWLAHTRQGIEAGYPRYRVVLGKALLVGLELLVAADIIRTVALDASLLNLATLAGLVGVRTFLGWTLTVEVEGRWPWQKEFPGGTAEGESMHRNGTGEVCRKQDPILDLGASPEPMEACKWQNP